MIKAKAVSNKFWILKDDSGKIGEINTIRGEYVINIKGNRIRFDSLENLKIKTGIKFTNDTRAKDATTDSATIYGFPYSGVRFNEMWDIKNKLPLFTKKEDSKSWFVAGYFSVKINNKWRTILSPKLIILERNEYRGPFKTPEIINGNPISNTKLSFELTSPLSHWFE